MKLEMMQSSIFHEKYNTIFHEKYNTSGKEM